MAQLSEARQAVIEKNKAKKTARRKTKHKAAKARMNQSIVDRIFISAPSPAE